MRTYAAFFEWSEKSQKELGVVEELIASLNCSAGLGLHSPQIQQPDPPDCYCFNASGERVGVEVAEVVCKRAAHLNAQGKNVMRVWETGELAGHISHRLKDKDKKAYHGGPYAALIACLFTDEPMLSLAQAKSELGGLRFGPFKQLTSAYLLFSYEPSIKSYPLLRLEFEQ
jgi:hypothetical protein